MTTLVLPFPTPAWIYEGVDPGNFEDATGIITNRAPKQVQLNVDFLKTNLEFALGSTENIYRGFIGAPLHTLIETYEVNSIVKNSDGQLYISKTAANINNILTNTTHWGPITFGILDGITSLTSTWSSIKIEQSQLDTAIAMAIALG